MEARCRRRPKQEFPHQTIRPVALSLAQRINHRVPEARAVGAGLGKAATAEFSPDQEVEVAMRHKHRSTVGEGARDQNIGGLARAVLRAPIVLDFGMIARVPENARDDRPFRHTHLEKRNARRGKGCLREQWIGNQLGLRGEHAGAFVGSFPAAGENGGNLAHEVLQLFGRYAPGIETRLFVSVDIVAELVVRRAWRNGDIGLSVSDKNDPFGKPGSCLGSGFDRLGREIVLSPACGALCRHAQILGQKRTSCARDQGLTAGMERGGFADKVVIVTGSASGIGAAVAISLAQARARVVINYARSEAEAREVAAAAERAGGEVRVVRGDVANDADCRTLAQAALDAWGRIDILVNNAGTTTFANHGDLDALTAEDFARIYAVNVTGAYQMTRACRGALRESHGAIVNVSSIAGIAGVGSSVAYAASKGALNTMTLSLARALAPEIRINAVCPGYVATPWFEKRFGEARFAQITAEQAQATPLKRAGEPQDIADAVLYLASPAARHITGVMLVVDGGMHLSLPR